MHGKLNASFDTLGFATLGFTTVRILSVCALLVYALLAPSSHAEPNSQLPVQSLSSLKNDLDRVSQRLVENSKPKSLTKKLTQRNLQSLSLDSIDNFIDTRQKYMKLDSTYRGLEFFRKLNEWTGADFLATDSEEMAKELCVYHAITLTSEYIKRSPLENTYRTIVEDLKKLRDNSTVGLSQHNGGKLELHHGANNSKNSFLQLRLHANFRHGLETQLKIGDNLRLRHGVLDSETTIEYVTNF